MEIIERLYPRDIGRQSVAAWKARNELAAWFVRKGSLKPALLVSATDAAYALDKDKSTVAKTLLAAPGFVRCYLRGRPAGYYFDSHFSEAAVAEATKEERPANYYYPKDLKPLYEVLKGNHEFYKSIALDGKMPADKADTSTVARKKKHDPIIFEDRDTAINAIQALLSLVELVRKEKCYFGNNTQITLPDDTHGQLAYFFQTLDKHPEIFAPEREVD